MLPSTDSPKKQWICFRERTRSNDIHSVLPTQGEYVSIMGESGSGKTTLLNILAALNKPTSGQVILDGKELSAIKESEIAKFRRDNLGFVFQDFNLLDTFSVMGNIFLPQISRA